jgi:hypothetical protein
MRRKVLSRLFAGNVRSFSISEGVVGPVNVEQANSDLNEDGEAAFTLDFADPEPLVEEGITLEDLTLLSCRWPIGNPHDLATFRYCGEPASSGSYCQRHTRLAYLKKKG